MEWLKQNAWGFVIAGIAIASTFSLYGYRITALEARADHDEENISSMDEIITQLQITLAKLDTNVEYIKEKINKIGN